MSKVTYEACMHMLSNQSLEGVLICGAHLPCKRHPEPEPPAQPDSTKRLQPDPSAPFPARAANALDEAKDIVLGQIGELREQLAAKELKFGAYCDSLKGELAAKERECARLNGWVELEREIAAKAEGRIAEAVDVLRRNLTANPGEPVPLIRYVLTILTPSATAEAAKVEPTGCDYRGEWIPGGRERCGLPQEHRYHQGGNGLEFHPFRSIAPQPAAPQGGRWKWMCGRQGAVYDRAGQPFRTEFDARSDHDITQGHLRGCSPTITEEPR